MIRFFGTDKNEAWSFNSEYPRYAIHAGGGADAVIDRSISDSNIFGGAGNDILQTYAGNDRLHGEKGNDTFFISNTGNSHQVEIWGGRGHDTALIESDSAALAKTTLENGDVAILYVNGTVVMLHGVEDVLMIQHSEIPPWI